MSKIGDSIMSMIDNVANNMATLTNSYVYTGTSMSMLGTNSAGGQLNNSRYNVNSNVYYKFLRPYHFVSAVLDIFTSTISETIDKSDFRVEIPDNEQFTDLCNKFLQKIDLKDYLKTHMNEMIYRGQYSILIDYVSGEISDIVDPYNADIILNKGNVIGYKLNNKYIPRTKMSTYYYRIGEVVPISDKTQTKNLNRDIKNGGTGLVNNPNPNPVALAISNMGNAPTPPVNPMQVQPPMMQGVPMMQPDMGLPQMNPLAMGGIGMTNPMMPPTGGLSNQMGMQSPQNNPLKDIIVEYSKFKGESIFKNALSRIFQLYTLEYTAFYLGLRDSIRPELIGVSTGNRQVNVAQALNMANSIESILNQSAQGLSNIVDPLAFMNNLTFQLLNYIKVLPSVDQYSNINDIQFSDLSNKRERILAEVERVKNDILNEMTIPIELFSGNANRWEVLARNDRFMTTCDALLKSFTRFIKDICYSFAQFSGVNINLTSIKFKLDCMSMLNVYDVKDKLNTVSEKFMNMERIAQSYINLTQTGIFSNDKLLAYLREQVASIDDKLAINILEATDAANQQKDMMDRGQNIGTGG